MKNLHLMWKEIRAFSFCENTYVDTLGVCNKQLTYYDLKLIFGSTILSFLFWNTILT